MNKCVYIYTYIYNVYKYLYIHTSPFYLSLVSPKLHPETMVMAAPQVKLLTLQNSLDLGADANAQAPLAWCGGSALVGRGIIQEKCSSV